MPALTTRAGARDTVLRLRTMNAALRREPGAAATPRRQDPPAPCATAPVSLAGRASGLSALLASMTGALAALAAAEDGLATIIGLVQELQATLRRAQRERSFQSGLFVVVDPGHPPRLSLSGGAVGDEPVEIVLPPDPAAVTATTAGAAFRDIAGLEAASAAHLIAAATYGPDNAFNGSADCPWTIRIVTAAGSVAVVFDGTLDGATAIADARIHDYTAEEAIRTINHALAAAGVAVTADLCGGHLRLAAATVGRASNVRVEGLGPTVHGGFGPRPIATANGRDAGAGVGFHVIVGGERHAIAITPADVVAAGRDPTGGGLNSLNLVAAIDATLAAAGLGTIRAVKSGPADRAHDDDTIRLRACDPGTRFTVAGVTGAVIGSATATEGGAAAIDRLIAMINGEPRLAGKVAAVRDGDRLRIDNHAGAPLIVAGLGDGPGLVPGNAVRRDLEHRFAMLRAGIDAAVDGAGRHGRNLLRGDRLDVAVAPGREPVTLEIRDADGLGIDAALDTGETLAVRLDGLAAALDRLRGEVASVAATRATVQNRLDFARSILLTLSAGADAFVVAEAGEEGAAMLALQTRQQLSGTALSLSDRTKGTVLGRL